MSDGRPIGERVASLESRVGNLETAMAKAGDAYERIAQKQQEILNELNRYRGAWGMLLLVLTAFTAAARLFKDWIAQHLK